MRRSGGRRGAAERCWGRFTVNVALVAGLLAALGAVGVASSAETSAPEATAPREQVGTVEQVDAVLGYLDADRTATFRYPEADYVKVHLSQLLLLPGDYLTVSDPAGEEVYRLTSGWATSITGDTAVVTLHQTQPDPLGLRAELARLGVTIDKVARGFVPAEEPSPGREESVCGRDESRDAVCYKSSHPTIYRNTKPVARLLIDGVELCTAFRVGPENRLLTNHHCISNSRQAQRTEVWFNYQCAECDGWAVFRPTKVRGDRVLDTDSVLDYTLFTVDRFAKVERFGYLELDPRPVKAGEELYVPQHPRGLPTRVALRSDQDLGGSCAVSDPQVHGYGFHTDMAYYCDTDGGSSGSPVLSRTSHRVIALHHFGGCPNSGVRMDLIHARISSSI
jgi:lysyl endopeptidase